MAWIRLGEARIRPEEPAAADMAGRRRKRKSRPWRSRGGGWADAHWTEDDGRKGRIQRRWRQGRRPSRSSAVAGRPPQPHGTKPPPGPRTASSRPANTSPARRRTAQSRAPWCAPQLGGTPSLGPRATARLCPAPHSRGTLPLSPAHAHSGGGEAAGAGRVPGWPSRTPVLGRIAAALRGWPFRASLQGLGSGMADESCLALTTCHWSIPHGCRYSVLVFPRRQIVMQRSVPVGE
ncbi:hypothetical protein BS78_K085700 [Paspalum vaginatum]|uniref:Uncharacterized protein n=1 Tax=Paspalum vaginatum TaxID=158149 RepID=A0A9W7XF03_9POAL|nr:hypothetical protein BS78_K153700 [Paspalum vaginatum]KAJ1253912.1 hypothetical protein BS78_K153700 [Paspalum vaginatum]KAJ1257355.1 hypothetical protein BS78_K085700 [Paspalum vaginatum]KAJ1257356.1 hypothetical protein BS78_K085700 [Paspalum vaginatum]